MAIYSTHWLKSIPAYGILSIKPASGENDKEHLALMGKVNAVIDVLGVIKDDAQRDYNVWAASHKKSDGTVEMDFISGFRTTSAVENGI